MLESFVNEGKNDSLNKKLQNNESKEEEFPIKSISSIKQINNNSNLNGGNQ